MSISNINTKSYWENRFATGDWEVKLGRNQTRNFALSQTKHLDIKSDFAGTILDFGCGLGDAFPIYKRAFPKAKLIGLDISKEAIVKCNARYGHLANFICGTNDDVPTVDIIIASNVFEHLTNDREIAIDLLKKCSKLYIIVPYNEEMYNNPKQEHVNSYTEFYFEDFTSNISFKIFSSRGWGKSGIDLYYNIYLKNIARLLLGRELEKNRKQIMFKLYN